MTIDQFRDLKERAKAAPSKGPWEADGLNVLTLGSLGFDAGGGPGPDLVAVAAPKDAAFIAAADPQTVLQLLTANEALAGMADSLARSPRRIPFEGFANGYEEFAMKRHSAALNAHQLPEEQVETILAWALDKAGKESPCPPSAPA
jgi:hypothetical protein